MPRPPYPLLLIVASLGFAGLHRTAAQTIYEQMVVRSPLPTPNHLNQVRYSGGRFLALGDNSTVISSEDGLSWTLHPTGYDRSVADIAFGNGVFVISGSDYGTVLTSYDLATWQVSRPEEVPSNGNGIVFANGRFHICGSQGTVASSSDGLTWSSVNTGTSQTLDDILFAGGQFISVGANNTVVTSPDGLEWTVRPTGIELSGLEAGLLSVTWLNNLYVVGGKQGTILTSPDGIVWTHRPYSEGTDWFYGGVFADGAYHLTGRQGLLRKTVDFVTWEEVATAPPGDNDIHGVVSAGGITVAVGRNGTINTSPDLGVWTSRKGGFSGGFSGLQYGGGGFVATDYDGVVRTSTDTVTWTDVFTMPDGEGLNDLAYGDGKFVAVSYNSQIIQSVDGQLWSAPVRQFEGFPGVQKVRFLNGRWFLLGRNGLLRSSANLSNWTVSDVTPAEEITDLIDANGLYVATGGNGTVFTSLDGMSFDPHESGTTSRLNAVAFGNGRLVAAGSGSTLRTSINGIDWSTDGVKLAPSNINFLMFREGRFVAFASYGQLGLSTDGLTWTTTSMGFPLNLSRFAEGNDRIVAAGGSGLLLSTDPLPDHALTISITGDGSVSVDPPGATFKQGTVVTLTATPGTQHDFLEWSGDATGTDNPLVLTMDSDKHVTANFQQTLTGYELWKVSEFNAAERLDPAISGPGANPDGDSRPNALEYLGGTGPKMFDQAAPVTASTARLGEATYAILTYVRKKGLNDLTDRVAVSGNLDGWHYNGDGTGGTYTALFNLTDGPDNTETVSIRSLTPVAPGQPQFLRLEVVFP
ncbi:MAG: hypothetical protein H7A46_07240 [Verrucomicrobiales bacterium]|nr:hypothetical protein [Verrucomicrobiales bacterium]